jgi:PAS domain S-box-containing protein
MQTDPIDILIVDDTPQNLVTLHAILDEPGLNVVTARSARDALRCLLRQDFAAILLDVNMPGMDGFEVAALIRQRPASSRTPILFLTAYPGEAALSRAYALGAVDYILTPVQPEVLRAKVAVFADLFRKTVEVRRQAERLREAEEKLRQQAEDALRESEGRFRVLCTSAPVAIFQTDAAGHCVYVSPLWESMTGQPAHRARGLGWLELLGTEDVSEVLPGWLSTAEGGRCWSREQKRADLSGQTRWMHIMASAIPNEGGTATGFVGTVEDITTRKRNEEQLREADRLKDEFLAMLAHELRNPLAAISSAVTVSRTPGMEARRDWTMEVIARQLEHLTHLIDDLLDVSRITMGKIQLRENDLDLTRVLARAIETIQPRADARGQQLSVRLAAGPLWVRGDPVRLEQVFGNLLSNAVKYNYEGGAIEVTAAAGDGEIEVRVRDSGIGIEPHMLGRIFDLFAQGTAGSDRTGAGLGIGLSLARKLTELHGGAVTARSDGPGRGSEFVVRLPVARQPVAVSAITGGPTDSSEEAGLKVLVVDDNVDVLEAAALLLEASGHHVLTADRGERAVEIAIEKHPDVVLLDLGLPGMTGYDVAERLRRQYPGDAMLLVAVSGYGQEEDRRRTAAAGFHHHLVKPVSHEVLVSLLAEVGRRRRQQPAASSPRQLPGSSRVIQSG